MPYHFWTYHPYAKVQMEMRYEIQERLGLWEWLMKAYDLKCKSEINFHNQQKLRI